MSKFHWLSRLRKTLTNRERPRSSRRAARLAGGRFGSAEALEDRTLLAAPNPVFLATLNGTNGFRLDGIDAGDGSGFSVSNAGDVNGDGFDDVLIGAWKADPGGDSNAGESYVVFGRAGGFTSSLNLSTLNGTNGFRLDGIDVGDFSGISVSGAGDVNGDGFDDLIIGADYADRSGASDAGESYVVFGRASGFASSLDLSTLNGTDGFRLDGIDTEDGSGHSVSSAGDVNGDGFGDLIIGAARSFSNNGAGESYVVFGRANGFAASVDLSTLNGTDGFLLDGIDVNDQSGRSVSSAGDVNGDGFDDLIIAARFADPGGVSNAGGAHVVFGKSGGFAASLDLSTLNGTDGFRLDGIDVNDQSGRSVSSAGDVNGDGFDDLIIGANYADPGGDSEAGESYVVFGKSGGFASSLDLSELNGTNGFRLDGSDAGDSSGISVSSAGDVNGDGFDDLIIGALYGNPGGDSNAGESYVVFGRAGGFTSSLNLSTLNGTNGFRLDGIDAGDQSGWSVSSAEDVNGDGFNDLIIGAVDADPGGVSNAGESYVVFGGNFMGGAETQVGTSGANTLTANQGASAIDILVGGLGNDVLISDGGADVLRGGEGDDTLIIPDVDFGSTRRLVGGSGLDELRLDGSGLTLDLTTIRDNRIVDIEFIDITGSGNNSLTLDVLEVLNISSHSNTLFVMRDAGDTVSVGTGWTQAGLLVSDGRFFQILTQGAATLVVQEPAGVSLNNAGGDYEILRDGADLVLRVVGGSELFRQDAGLVPTLAVQGSSNVDTVTVLNSGTAVNTPIVFEGAGANDSFDGTLAAGPVSLFGGAGNDTLTGGNAADLLNGDGGEDRLFGNSGFDTLRGGLGNDFLRGGAGEDLLEGGANNDTIVGDAGNDEIYGDDGADRVFAGSGNDFVDGGEGDDQIFGDAGSDTITGSVGNDSIRGGSDNDLIGGNAGRDTLFGDAGNDVVFGEAGDDTVFGGTGRDDIFGDEGNDRLFGENGYDTISGGLGNDFIRGGRGADLLSGDDGQDEIIGDEHNDTASGGAGNDSIATGGGADVVFAGAGDDTVDGGAGDDQLYGDAGSDTVSGSTGRDLIRGGNDNDLLTGDGGFDTLFGDRGDDTIAGGDGDDTVFGGNGRDSVSGGAGNDRLFGNNGYDTISGGLGNDFIRGARGRDSLTGDDGDDELIGDEHEDTLIGGSGSDRVTGGAGADTIDVQEASLSDDIDSVIGSDMTDTVFKDPADLLI